MTIYPKHLIDRKAAQIPIVILTAFDYITAHCLESAGVDVILIGDSLGNVFAGHDSTHPVTVRDMIYHTQAVKRGAKNSLIISDMPFLSTQIDRTEAKRHAGALIQEAGAGAVKIEVFSEHDILVIEAIIQMGIPVMGHLGLTPQAVHQLGGYRKQAVNQADQDRLFDFCQRLETVGCFGIVLECVPGSVAKQCKNSVSIPIIGIGSGSDCDGQVLVTHDLLGLTPGKTPSFAKASTDLYQQMQHHIGLYKESICKTTSTVQ